MRWIPLLIFALAFGPPSALEDAQVFYQDGKFLHSVESWRESLEKYPAKSSMIHYNMGQCYLRMDSIETALDEFRRSMSQSRPQVASYALNNAGVIFFARKDQNMMKEAIASFKDALRRDPDNEEARYNYELLMKLNAQQNEEQDQEDENNDEQEKQNQPPNNNPPPSNLPREGSGNKPEYQSISMEQARRLLEGMNENEKKFIQQLRRNPVKQPKMQEGAPGW